MRRGAIRLSRRPVTLRRTAQPLRRARHQEIIPPDIPVLPLQAVPKPDGPFVGYNRTLTPEGGILIVYKDFDIRWRWMAWAALAWTFATGFEFWFIRYHSPVDGFFINAGCFLLAAVANWLIVRNPPEISRSIEVRSDCMIVEGTDVFWLEKIGYNWPTFKADENHKDRQILCGIYGTRYVEYVTTHLTDELDRTPDVLASHLHDAMTKLWGDGTADPGTLGPSTPMGRRRY
jgi:hypothetical protein